MKRRRLSWGEIPLSARDVRADKARQRPGGGQFLGITFVTHFDSCREGGIWEAAGSIAFTQVWGGHHQGTS